MYMYNPDDKDLDRLSRDAAENYVAPGAPSWETLQQTLNKEMPQEKRKKRGGFFFFFLLTCLLAGGSLYWYGFSKKIPASIAFTNKKNNTVVENKNTLQNKNTISGERNNTSTSTVAGDKNISIPVSQKRAKEVPDNHHLSVTFVKVTNTPVTRNNQTSNDKNYRPEKMFRKRISPPAIASFAYNKKEKQSLAFNHKPYISSVKRKEHKNYIPVGITKFKVAEINDYSKTVIKNSVTKTATSDSEIKDDYTTTDKIIGQNPDPSLATPGIINDKVLKTKDSAVSKTITEPEKKEITTAIKKKKNEKAIVAGLTAGADLSTVRYTHSDEIGFNMGLMGGYQFNKNWSVYTGIIYTKKNYELNGSDYHPPKHYWTSYINLITVDGYCRMWEVPLLARYTFNSKSNNKFFISTGISSYFMKKQQYNYLYKTSSGSYENKAWSNDSSFNHIFSILHLSAGFEKHFGKHMNWQIEPYAKIPLAGVGFGNIKLSSFGVNFSIQYRQALKH
jgi:Outer membrane protein beta-barrel domain